MKKKKHKYFNKTIYIVTDYLPKNKNMNFPIRLTKHNHKHIRLLIRLKKVKYTIRQNWLVNIYMKSYR